MSNESVSAKEKRYNRWVWVASIAIPVVVAILFGIKLPNVEPLTFLPPIYATTNAITAILLVFAFWAIKSGNRKRHETLIKICMLLSLAFLAMYVAYHMTSESIPYGGEGFLKYVYYVILISHIILSIVVIPFVLITYVRAILGNFRAHKKIARYTFPLWLYVAVSGVLVFIMISPYY